jgi:uroporphyrinogen decarboxylase
MERDMTAKERVRSAVAHHEPDRVPFSWGLGITDEMAHIMQEYLQKWKVNFDALRENTEDVITVEPAYTGPPLPNDTDIWGIKRKRVAYEGGSYDEISFSPLAEVEHPADLQRIEWPDPDFFDFKGLRQSIAEKDPEGVKAKRLAIGVCGNILEIYTWMTGLEKMMLNLMLKPDLVQRSLEKISDYFFEMTRRVADECGGEIDILYFADDLGGQQGPLISPELYRSLINPCHRRLMEAASGRMPGTKVMFHSDGSVFDLLPDLIDAGVDILEAVQVDAKQMEPERLKRTFCDRLSFHGGISVQSLLPLNDEQTVRDGVARLVEIFGRGGGYIAAPSHRVQVGTPPENVIAMLETVLGPKDFGLAWEMSR